MALVDSLQPDRPGDRLGRVAVASGGSRSDDPNIETLVATLGHGFRRPELLRQALTHASATPNRRGGQADYERLEFLGDRVLALIIADLLIARFPAEPEGALARRLSALVCRETLAVVAGEIGLDRHLILGPGEQGPEVGASLLADACEAVIGALYLDGGLRAAAGFVEPHWIPCLEAEPTPPQDAKTTLQEWAQGRGLPLPDYREVAREGPPHEPLFTLEVTVQGHAPARGRGRSKRLAQQGAAASLLNRLTGQGDGQVDSQVDGQAENTCCMLAVQADGKSLMTVKGMGTIDSLHPLQQAFIELGAIQCGFCTPGMLCAAQAFLEEYPKPTRHEIKVGISGNLCRCTGYVKIIDAIEAVAQGKY